MKWYGKRKQKLVITWDEVTESLREKLDKFATLNRVNDRDGEQNREAEGDLNLGEVTDKSLLDDNIHEPSLSITENGHKFKNLNVTVMFFQYKWSESKVIYSNLNAQLKHSRGNEQ